MCIDYVHVCVCVYMFGEEVILTTCEHRCTSNQCYRALLRTYLGQEMSFNKRRRLRGVIK